MSDNEKAKDPDYEQKFSTINMEDVMEQGIVDVSEDFEVGQDSQPKTITRSTSYPNVRKPKKDRRTSLVWTKFTMISKKDHIAACNICDQRLSVRSTSGNLKKHLERKHGFSLKLGVLPKRASQPKYITPKPRPKVSELAGVLDEGITVKVVGENGEEEHFQLIGEQFLSSEEVVHGDVQEHGYSTKEHRSEEVHVEEIESEPLRIERVRSLNETQSSQSKKDSPRFYTPYKTFTSCTDERSKRQRIMELQMECLENKKYNMQLEALQMEQQLNLPRSIFTQTLRYTDSQTRSTQTEVGGGDTKVFYITDKRGGRPIQQLFTLQDLDF